MTALPTELQISTRRTLRGKLVAMLALTAAAAALLTCISFLLYDAQMSSEAREHRIFTLAHSVAISASTAIERGDTETADEVLEAIAADGTVRHAVIYDRAGRPLAQWSRDRTLAWTAPSFSRGDPWQGVSGDDTWLRVGAHHRGVEFGSVYVQADTSDLDERMRRFIYVALFVFFAVLLFAMLAAMQVQRSITEPIGAVAEVAARVMVTGDYGARAPKTSHDEIGVLADSFNEMLATIGARDEELAAHRTALEETVEIRTRALQRSMEEAQAASRAKSRFLATMSHEIRTPLNAVTGMTSLLLNSPLTLQQRDYAETVRRSADTLLGLISDILDFSKIEAGRMDLESRPFSPRRVLEEVAEQLAEQAQSKGLEIAVVAPPDFQRRVVGDEGRIRQVLANLVANAVKFTPNGEVLLRGRLLGEQSGRLKLRFEVKDTGIGVDEAKVQQLLEPFVQEDSSTTRRFGGTGLGLAISNELITLMGGDLKFRSRPGRGSTFGFTVELEAFDEPEMGEPLDVAIRGRKVLVNVRSAAAREQILVLLRGWGMDAMAVGSQDAAVAQLLGAAGSIELLVCDAPENEADEQDLVVLTTQAELEAMLMMTPLSFRGRSPALPPGLPESLSAGYVAKPVRQSELLDALRFALSPQDDGPQPLRRLSVPADQVSLMRWPGRRVLLVEDFPINQRVAVGLLRKHGFVVELASDGVQAVERCSKREYDLVLMDCQMPEMDGYQATRTIRAREAAKGNEAPGRLIIAMTANAMAGDRELCLEAGMDDYIPKPVNPGELASTIARWLPPDKMVQAEEPAILSEAPGSDSTAANSQVLDADGDVGAREELAAVDLRCLERLFDDEDEDEDLEGMVREIAGEFLLSTKETFTRLLQAAEEGSLNELTACAHKLKSALGMVGALPSSELCAAMERSAREGNLESTLGNARRVVEVAAELVRRIESQAGLPKSGWTLEL